MLDYYPWHFHKLLSVRKIKEDPSAQCVVVMPRKKLLLKGLVTVNVVMLNQYLPSIPKGQGASL